MYSGFLVVVLGVKDLVVERGQKKTQQKAAFT